MAGTWVVEMRGRTPGADGAGRWYTEAKSGADRTRTTNVGGGLRGWPPTRPPVAPSHHHGQDRVSSGSARGDRRRTPGDLGARSSAGFGECWAPRVTVYSRAAVGVSVPRGSFYSRPPPSGRSGVRRVLPRAAVNYEFKFEAVDAMGSKGATLFAPAGPPPPQPRRAKPLRRLRFPRRPTQSGLQLTAVTH